MAHSASDSDREFQKAFEAFDVSPDDFDHRAHVRLAYIYLSEHDVDEAFANMRNSLLAFLNSLGVGASKYHETITRAWILATCHFMTLTPDCTSADMFVEKNPQILDSSIMLSHYSAGLLFSPEARAEFVDPDLQPIPPKED